MRNFHPFFCPGASVSSTHCNPIAISRPDVDARQPAASGYCLGELLIERNADNGADADGLIAKETKLFVRIRRDGDFTDTLGYYIRGGVGRSFNNQRNFSFAYLEPGLESMSAPRPGNVACSAIAPAA